MRDRAGQVDRDITTLTTAIDTVTDRLCQLSVEDTADRRRPERLRKAPKTVSDPTVGPIVGWEADLEGYVDSLATIIVKAAKLAAECGNPVDEPLDGWLKIMDDDCRTRPRVASRAWRLQVREAGRLAMAAVTCLHDGWHLAHRQRWIIHPQGGQVLDEQTDLWCTEVAGEIDLLARRAKGLSRRVAPDRPAQPTLVYCRHHPDKLAKYRGLALCGACYEQERRSA